MKIYKSLENVNFNKSLVTIGAFDGIHLGHQKILNKLTSQSKELGLESTIFTFYPYPKSVFSSDLKNENICTQNEKIKILEKLGIDNLIIYPFSKEFAKLKFEDFIKNILIKKLNMKKLLVGYDNSFGERKKGNINSIQEISKSYNFDIELVKPYYVNNEIISSTLIRGKIKAGEINIVNKYLSRKYSITGAVIHGKKNGHKIGFPTANIAVNKDKLIPKNGVYSAKVVIANIEKNAIVNIGTNPTFGKNKASIEVHILEFDGDIYGEILTAHFVDFIRNEKKFDDIDSLKKQIEKDIIISNKLLSLYD